MSNGSITLSGDDIRKIMRSVFGSCPTAQRLGTPSEHLLFLYRTHPSKRQACPLWHLLQFLLSEGTFSVWCSALNVGLPLSETKLGHSHCIPASEGDDKKTRRDIVQASDKSWSISRFQASLAQISLSDPQLAQTSTWANHQAVRIWKQTYLQVVHHVFPLTAMQNPYYRGFHSSPGHGRVAQWTPNMRRACIWGS